jgi:hypothetical protein
MNFAVKTIGWNDSSLPASAGRFPDFAAPRAGSMGYRL